jgi:hypothetical protein
MERSDPNLIDKIDVARSTQVYIGLMEATDLLSSYRRNE